MNGPVAMKELEKGENRNDPVTGWNPPAKLGHYSDKKQFFPLQELKGLSSGIQHTAEEPEARLFSAFWNQKLSSHAA